MRSKSKPRRAKLKRTLPGTLALTNRESLAAELTTLITSPLWGVIKGILAEEVFTHDCAMRSFIKKTELHAEAAWECGASEALDHVANTMIPQFVETLRSGKAAGLIEGVREEDSQPSEG